MSLTEVCLIRKHNATIQGDENGDQPHSCSVDFASIAVASIVIYVTLMVHVYLRFCGGGNGGMRGKKGRNEDKAEDVVKVQRLFCHNLIWLAMVAQLLNSAFMLGEIIMIFAKQGQLFSVSMADGILQVLCAVVIPVYFDSAEERGAGLLTLLPLFAHFFGMSSVFGLRHLELTKMGFSYSDLRMATTCIAIAVNSLLFTLLSVAAARKLVSDRRQRNSSSSIRDEAASDKVYRYDNASLASKMTFSWMLPLLRRGYKTPLEIADLHQLPERERARKHYEIMKKLTRRPEDGIIRQCIYMNSKLIVIGGIFRFWADIFGLAGALSIKFIVDSMSEEAYRLLQSEAKANETLTSDSMLPDYQPSYHALSVEEFFSDSYVIAVLIFLAALCQGSFSQTANHLLTLAGMRAKNALHVRLYEKALRLPVGTAQRGSASPSTEEMPICFENSCSADDEAMANEGNIDIGFITNLASDDILNIREFIWNIHYLWALPLKVIVIIGLLYLKMGISGAVGVIIGTLVIVPLQFLTGKLMSDNNKRIFTAQDIRLFKASETMQGMKTVKLGCLEDFMLGKINAARKMELRFLRRDSFFWSVMAFLASVSTIIVTTVTVGLYVALEEEHFSAADIFSALALLGQLTVCLSVFPVTIPIFIKGMVSRERLVEFFSRTEVSIYKESDRKDSKKSTKWSEQAKAKDYENDDCEEETENNTPEYNENDIEKKRPFSAVGSVQPSVSSSSAFPDIAFSISSGFFGWPKSNRCVLKDINMHVRTGTLTAVVGPSGGGKSALILALMEEMERVRGHVKWNLPSAVALTGQNPWLLNASVKDNVLLGRPYREKRYQKVLAACDLNADIEVTAFTKCFHNYSKILLRAHVLAFSLVRRSMGNLMHVKVIPNWKPGSNNI
jgi:ABC-type multidrug transport system fused ATPase/permease subunit